MALDPAALAHRLHDARGTATRIALTSGEVGSVADGYAIQAELIRLSGDPVSGWKVSALPPGDRRELGVSNAIGGGLLHPYSFEGGASVPLSRFVAPRIECEIAFLLGADLPARSEPYSRAEVEAAVAAVLPAFELADSRISTGATPFTKVADSVNSGALVTGAPLAGWRNLDLSSIGVRLTHDGAEVATGSSAVLPCDPISALVDLANAQPLPAPLASGQVVITGSCTGMLPVRTGTYVGWFAGLGEVQLRFT